MQMSLLYVLIRSYWKVCVCVCGSELGNIIMGIGIDTCILYRDDREKRLKDVSKGCGMEMLISVEDCVKAFIY
jgi:hypothetical protein